MKIQPLKGMRDLLPAEQTLRDYIQGQILEVYRAAGFERISTPLLEDLENLDKSEGGENLNLIFKVLKRGDKLAAALAAGPEGQLADMGLRYDLTLPLSRYYAANRSALPTPSRSSRPTGCSGPSAPRRAACASLSSATSTSWGTRAPTPRWN